MSDPLIWDLLHLLRVLARHGTPSDLDSLQEILGNDDPGLWTVAKIRSVVDALIWMGMAKPGFTRDGEPEVRIADRGRYRMRKPRKLVSAKPVHSALPAVVELTTNTSDVRP